MLRSAAFVAAIALVTAGGASAEVVARGVQDGLLALDAKGTPSVAWVHHSTLFVGTPQDLAAKFANVSVREIGRASCRERVLTGV